MKNLLKIPLLFSMAFFLEHNCHAVQQGREVIVECPKKLHFQDPSKKFSPVSKEIDVDGMQITFTSYQHLPTDPNYLAEYSNKFGSLAGDDLKCEYIYGGRRGILSLYAPTVGKLKNCRLAGLNSFSCELEGAH